MSVVDGRAITQEDGDSQGFACVYTYSNSLDIIDNMNDRVVSADIEVFNKSSSFGMIFLLGSGTFKTISIGISALIEGTTTYLWASATRAGTVLELEAKPVPILAMSNETGVSKYHTTFSILVRIEAETGRVVLQMTNFGNGIPDEAYVLGTCSNCDSILDGSLAFLVNFPTSMAVDNIGGSCLVNNSNMTYAPIGLKVAPPAMAPGQETPLVPTKRLVARACEKAGRRRRQSLFNGGCK